MLEKIRLFKVRQNDTGLFYQFDLGRFVKKIVLTPNNVFADASGKKITVKYAQNGIISDLIFAGEQTVTGAEKIEFEFENSFSATHVYFIADIDLNGYDIEIYEELKESVTNYYPTCFDKDLGENYFLDTVSVFTSKDGFSHYSVFTSINGVDYDFLAEKQNDEPCNENGDIFFANKKEARFIRVYFEYNSASPKAILNDLKFTGEKSNTEIIYPQKINIPKFEDTEYNVPVTINDTYNEVYGIVERTVGKGYKAWFKLEIAENCSEPYDYFELSNTPDKKILIKGNNGVSLASGLNHYLKYFCNVLISQLGNQTKMPENPVPLDNTVHKETKARVRYAYNYCTHSYTMAFWGETEWRRELDWLALNGVNLVLDITAQEEVWRRFLGKLNYTHEEIKRFLTGPAYYAWLYMANMSHYGGPVHDSWFKKRTDLARKNQRIMCILGMSPVLQGYSGMAPNDILDHDKSAEIVLQGTWCSFDRPVMLRTTSKCFKKYAKLFYESQSEVYGNITEYFAVDPFHEGGNMGDMSPREVAGLILKQMLEYNKSAIWVIQSWMSNPSSELLAGIGEIENGKRHALILDLYAEKQPNYKKGSSGNPDHGYSPEFDGTPWVFCMLNNFGGRCGLHGHIDNLNSWIPDAFNKSEYISGIGITAESTYNNPILYDFLLESVWRDNAECDMQSLDLKEWLHKYTQRRYGINSDAVNGAWDILINTVYRAKFNNIGQGAVDAVSNSKPALKVRAASSWGNDSVTYDKKVLVKAGKLLIKDYDRLKHNEGYIWDLVALFQQILVNKSQDIQLETAKAFEEGSLSEFRKLSRKFLNIFDIMDELLSQSEYCTLGRWLSLAEKAAENTDDFTKRLYQINAKAQITTWGSFEQCETGGLRDYANKQWSGLEKDFYKCRWQLWINERIRELKGEEFREKINWFDYEWRWVRSDKKYPKTANDIDIPKIVDKILAL